MVLRERAAEIFAGPLPSPFMLFTHRVREGWAERIPAVVHVDGTARIQTISPTRDPLVAAMLAAWLDTARWPYERPADLSAAVADVLAADGVVGWFAGRSEYGPRALGHRSLLANPGRRETLTKLNDVKGREQFRPVAPMIRLDRAADVFDGPLPSPYMLFVHRVRPHWRDRIPAVVHVDGTARAQTVDPGQEPAIAGLLDAFERRTGLPCLVNTSLNTAGRPMVDDPRDALELFGSAPVDVLVLGPYLVRRPPS